jgi:hypothetical protein
MSNSESMLLSKVGRKPNAVSKLAQFLERRRCDDHVVTRSYTVRVLIYGSSE